MLSTRQQLQNGADISRSPTGGSQDPSEQNFTKYQKFYRPSYVHHFYWRMMYVDFYISDFQEETKLIVFQENL